MNIIKRIYKKLPYFYYRVKKEKKTKRLIAEEVTIYRYSFINGTRLLYRYLRFKYYLKTNGLNYNRYRSICETCGSTNVLTTGWIEINNNNKFVDIGLLMKEDNWCNECEKHTSFVNYK